MSTGNAHHAFDIPAASRVAASAALAFAASAAWAQVPGEKTVDGVRFNVGVASVEQVLALPASDPERNMHAHPYRHGTEHLVVALADARSGAPIGRANVTATVSRLGMEEQSRTLELMRFPGAPSWGDYFDMRAPGPYRIHLVASLPGRGPVAADFEYRNR
jgi:hypothetical protein